MDAPYTVHDRTAYGEHSACERHAYEAIHYAGFRVTLDGDDVEPVESPTHRLAKVGS